MRRIVDFLQTIEESSAQWQYTVDWKKNIETTRASKNAKVFATESGPQVCQFAKHIATYGMIFQPTYFISRIF